MDEGETRAAVAENPDGFEELWWGKKLVGLRTFLPNADSTLILELLEEAWREVLP